MAKKKDLAVVKTAMPKIQEQSAEMLISQAIEKGTSVDTMERLLAMRRELKAEWSKEQFDNAMADFQTDCPTIQKTKGVRTKEGKMAYKYAPIESIVEQVKPFLKTYGFSYSIQQVFNNESKMVKITCKVKHKDGHSEDYEMEVPLGTKTGIMSDTQVVAAASTFAKRYAFCNAFGILTGDEDTDAVPQNAPVAPKPAQTNTYTKNNHGTPQIAKISPTDAQKKEIVKLCKDLDSSLKTKEQYEEFVEAETGLKLETPNYGQIIKNLKESIESLNNKPEVSVEDLAVAIDGEIVDEVPKKLSKAGQAMKAGMEKAKSSKS